MLRAGGRRTIEELARPCCQQLAGGSSPSDEPIHAVINFTATPLTLSRWELLSTRALKPGGVALASGRQRSRPTSGPWPSNAIPYRQAHSRRWSWRGCCIDTLKVYSREKRDSRSLTWRTSATAVRSDHVQGQTDRPYPAVNCNLPTYARRERLGMKGAPYGGSDRDH